MCLIVFGVSEIINSLVFEIFQELGEGSLMQDIFYDVFYVFIDYDEFFNVSLLNFCFIRYRLDKFQDFYVFGCFDVLIYLGDVNFFMSSCFLSIG